MLNGPYPCGIVIARLKAKVPALRETGNASDLETALATQANTYPAAFVLTQEQGGTPAGASGGMLIQTCPVVLLVVLMVRNYANTDVGGGARSEMDLLAKAVDAAVLNWTPQTGIYKPAWFTAGRDERYKAGTLVHQRIYRSEYHNRAPSNP